MDSTAVRMFERCLAQGSVSDNLLAEAQRNLAEESAQPLLVFALRGERDPDALVHVKC